MKARLFMFFQYRIRPVNFSIYLLMLWLLTSLICLDILPYVAGPDPQDTLHSLLLLISYSFIYLIPTMLVCRLLLPWYRVRLLATVILSALTIAFIFSDSRLYDLYGFHFNGFVWNLIITPGGFQSLGMDQTSSWVLLKYLAELGAGIALCIAIAKRFSFPPAHWRLVLSSLLLITLVERSLYGVAYAQNYGPILNQSDYMIMYQPLRMNSLLNSIGYEVESREDAVELDGAVTGIINYPLAEIALEKTENPYNVIILVAESMRYQDLFNARVMPHSMAFADSYAIQYNNHYSGGNGTRQGLFAMFYGLYGNYWDLFLRERTTPLLFDILNDYSYQYFIYTSSLFSYPEFDKTIFGSISPNDLTETSTGQPWIRDTKNVNMLLQDIDQRDKSKPFLGFAFFEASHARYSFPEELALESNYSETVDYASLTKKELLPMIDQLKARYINSANFLDTQFERVYAYLIANNMLENTIVLVTGDHGEEFMEKGRWGHNSSFVEEQIKVPMLLHYPGEEPKTIDTMTSHMDIAGMLISSLNVKNPISDYSLGGNLLKPELNDKVVVASWTDLGIISHKGKLVIPFKGSTQHQHLATTTNDEPTDLSQLTQDLSSEIVEVLTNSQKFVTK